MKKLFSLICLLGFASGSVIAEPVTTIRDNGDPAVRIDLVILGDGYTAADQSKYEADVDSLIASFFAVEPYNEYQNYFNVHRIDVTSNESGVDHPETGTFRDTALNSYYNCAGIQRLICTDLGAVNTVLSASVAVNQREIVLVMVNDPEYGGSGGSIAVISTHAAVVDLALHELGHSFGLLADEYTSSPPTCNNSVEPSEVNVTLETDRNLIKWNQGGGPPSGWIELSTAIPTPTGSIPGTGLFDGARYCVPGLGMYRSMDNSAMRCLGCPFGEVNEEQLVRRIYSFVSPVSTVMPAPGDSTVPSGSSDVISVTVPQPLTTPLDVEWELDGQPVVAGLSLSLTPTELTPGPHTVTLKVSDPTPRVRHDPAGLLMEEYEWKYFVTSANDSDGDGVNDVDDAFPSNPYEWLDTDSDGTGNNADADDDGDSMPDQWEIDNGLNPLDAADASISSDADSLSNLDEYLLGTDPNDSDTDDDTVLDDTDNCPVTSNTDQADADMNGVGDACDFDLGTAQFRDSFSSIWEFTPSITVWVDRVGPTTAPLTVNYHFEAITAVPGVDYVDDIGMITFEVGESSKPLTVYILNDNLFEGYGANQFNVRLTGNNVNPARDSFPVYVWNDDLYRGEARFDSATYYVSESAGSINLNIERINGSEADHSFCVVYDYTDTAVVGVDFSDADQCGTMQNGVSTDVITVGIFNNDQYDGEKYFDVSLTSSWGLAAPSETRVFIVDDEVATMRSPIQSIADINSNGMPDVVVAVPGSTHAHIRDGSTDALITDINFGSDAAFDMTVLPDLDSSGNPEVAVLHQQPSGQVRVQSRDSVSGNVVSNLWYGLQYGAVSMAVVPDYSGNGDPEIAVLGSELNTDAVRVQLRDSSSNTHLDNVFLGTQSIAADLVQLSDTSGNGMPEMGVLGVLKSNNHVRAQIWDSDTAAFQGNVWFGNKYQPHSMITMPDINSNSSDEIVAIGVDPATQNIRVQVRDSDTTATLFNIWLGAVNEAVGIASINDINSDGVADLAVLLKTPAGVGRVRVQSGSNGAFIRNLFYSVVDDPSVWP